MKYSTVGNINLNKSEVDLVCLLLTKMTAIFFVDVWKENRPNG